jgi:putative addiction module component (TIGR02574 family)
MDLKTLKLELLERIANLDDEARLLALKRLLDLPAGEAGGPPTYAVPGDHMSVVREGESPYLKLEDRIYTAEEVRALVEDILVDLENEDEELDPELIAELEKRDREMDSGKVKGYTWEEVHAILDGDRKKQRSGT